MKEWLLNIDRSIPDMKMGRRILYFVSESRDILETVVNKSAALQSAIGIKDAGDGNLFDRLERRNELICLTNIYIYNNVFGYINLKQTKKEIDKTTNKEIEKTKVLSPCALYLKDFHTFSEFQRAMMVKAFLDCKGLKDALLLISSQQLLIPDGFANEIEVIFDRALSRNDIGEILCEKAEAEARERNIKPLDSAILRDAAKDFEGLTTVQINNVLNSMQYPLHIVLPQKKHVSLIEFERRKDAEKDGTLRFLPLDDRKVVGQGAFAEWLDERKEDFKDPVRAAQQGTPAPKGVLLCGVPGTGKSAMAREVAKKYEVPLLSFDIDRLKNSKLGESEARLRRYLDRIDSFGSCVLLMDEIEKTFSSNKETHEVTKQMMGQLLTWMQDRKSNVFLYITANNIDSLPPELLRDGRLSGRFFVFMPSRDDLAAILREKLRPLLTKRDENGKIIGRGVVDEEFEALIQAEDHRNSDQLAGIFDQIARNARARNKQGDSRVPFMTGANLETLVEMTNRRIRCEANLPGTNVSRPYCFGDYRSIMLECAASAEFVPQGQSNMKDLVAMWLNAQKRQYQDVSAHTLLPFSRFADGRFTQKLEGGNDYDQFMIEVFQREIESTWKKNDEYEKRYGRPAADGN